MLQTSYGTYSYKLLTWRSQSKKMHHYIQSTNRSVHALRLWWNVSSGQSSKEGWVLKTKEVFTTSASYGPNYLLITINQKLSISNHITTYIKINLRLLHGSTTWPYDLLSFCANWQNNSIIAHNLVILLHASIFLFLRQHALQHYTYR